MRKLLLALALLCFASPALAQNTQCSDRPAADSSNACANTRFVQTHPILPGTITLPNGQIIVGNVSNVGAAVTMSQDCTLVASGAITCTKTNNVAFGVFATLVPTNVRAGDIQYWNGSAWVILAGNNSGTQTLTENSSGVPSWSAAGSGTVTACEGVTSGTCPPRFNFANCTITAAVAGNNLTVALKDNAGADPTAASPCNVWFRSSTAAPTAGSAIWVQRIVTAATSIVLNSGSTLGTVNTTAFRVWVELFDTGSTAVLGVSNQSTTSTIFPLDPASVSSTTACSACATATAAGTFYTTAAQTSRPFVILGYMDWGSGLTTAGTWASGPTLIQSMGEGIHKPGEPVRSLYNPITGVSTTTNTYAHSNTAPVAANGGLVGSQAITPSAAPNHVRVRAGLVSNTSAAAPYGFAFLTNSTPTTIVTVAMTFQAASAYLNFSLYYEGLFGSTAAVTYSLYGSAGSGTTTFNGVAGAAEFGGTSGTFIQVEEIMG